MVRGNNHFLRLLATITALAFSLAAVGQTTPPQGNAAAPAEPEAEDFSYRKKSLGRLRREFESSQKDFYALYNSVNDDDDYDVKCKSERSLGSRRKVFACKATFLTRYEASVAQIENDAIRGGGGDAVMNNVAIDEKQQILRGKISEAISGYAEVQQGFADLVKAKSQYEAKQQER